MRKLTRPQYFMLVSNVCLLLPVVVAAMYHEWLYLFFACGLFLFSPLFHWYRIVNRRSFAYWIYRRVDWLFAVCAFFYLYYYVTVHITGTTAFIFYALLTAVILFFWYGWKHGDYTRLHPWFHISAPIISVALLLLASAQ